MRNFALCCALNHTTTPPYNAVIPAHAGIHCNDRSIGTVRKPRLEIRSYSSRPNVRHPQCP